MQGNEPYQSYMQMGLFEVIERTVGDADSTITVRTTKLTGKGQEYFTNKIINNE
jgi:anti-repressor protein